MAYRRKFIDFTKQTTKLFILCLFKAFAFVLHCQVCYYVKIVSNFQSKYFSEDSLLILNTISKESLFQLILASVYKDTASV